MENSRIYYKAVIIILILSLGTQIFLLENVISSKQLIIQTKTEIINLNERVKSLSLTITKSLKEIDLKIISIPVISILINVLLIMTVIGTKILRL